MVPGIDLTVWPRDAPPLYQRALRLPMPLLKGVEVFSPRTFELNQENNMTTKDKVARRKLSLLELAQEMSNVAKACRIMGCCRGCAVRPTVGSPALCAGWI